jgi:hypothetical protein
MLPVGLLEYSTRKKCGGGGGGGGASVQLDM